MNQALEQAAIDATGEDADAEQATWEATEKQLHPTSNAFTWETVRRALAGVRDNLEVHQAVISAMVF